MIAATCFSGIGAPECAMPHWQWRWHAEIAKFPIAVMAARHPGSVNLGDVTAPDLIERARALGQIDVLVGGPPCQAFSIAGLRRSLADERGQLSLQWVRIIHAIRPVWAVTENVPGWLSRDDNAFGCFLAGLVGADHPVCTPDGSSWPRVGMVAGPRARACWRVLDAQYFGLAQRRERVFVVAGLGDRADPAAVLFERQGVCWNPSSRQQARQEVAGSIGAGSARSGGRVGRREAAANHLLAGTLTGSLGRRAGQPNDDNPADYLVIHDGGHREAAVAFGGNNTSGPIEIATALSAHGGPCGRMDFESETLIAGTLLGEGFDAGSDGTTGTPIVPVPFGDRAAPLDTDGYSQAIAGAAVRRLLPVECERLQGFSDHFTAITYRGRPAADGPRYKGLGNSQAVPVMRWLLSRIEQQGAIR